MAKDKWWKGLTLGLLIAVGAWAVFQLAVNLIKIPFESLGLINPIYQDIAIILFVVVCLLVGWHTGLKGALKKLVR